MKLSLEQRYELIVFPGYDEYFKLVNIFESHTEGRGNQSIDNNIPQSMTHLDAPRTKSKNQEEISNFIDFYREGLKTRIIEFLRVHRLLKINLTLNVGLIKILPDNVSLRDNDAREIFLSTNLDEWVDEQIEIFRTKYEENPFVGSNY